MIDEGAPAAVATIPIEVEPSGAVASLKRLVAAAYRWRRQWRELKGRYAKTYLAGRVLAYMALIAILVYMGMNANRSVHLNQIRWKSVIYAGALALFWWMGLALGWSWLVEGRVRFERVWDWCRTMPLRYLPGGIWGSAARATTVKGRARDKMAAVTMEGVATFCLALAAGGLWLTVHNLRYLPLIFVGVGPIVAMRLVGKRASLQRLHMPQASASYFSGFLAYGLFNMFCQLAVSGSRPGVNVLYVAGASCIAWAVGWAVVFAPSGFGVREVVYVWMLAGIYPTAQAEAAALLARLLMIVAEFTVLSGASLRGLHLWTRDTLRNRRGEVPEIHIVGDIVGNVPPAS